MHVNGEFVVNQEDRNEVLATYLKTGEKFLVWLHYSRCLHFLYIFIFLLVLGLKDLFCIEHLLILFTVGVKELAKSHSVVRSLKVYNLLQSLRAWITTRTFGFFLA